MRIWLVDIFEPLPEEGFPPRRYGLLTDELRRRGHEVLRFSSDFSHTRKAPRRVAAADDLRLLHAPAYRRNVSPRRLLSHAAVALDALRAFARESPPDLILACWGPLELAATCVRYGRRHRVPVCLDVLDPWPDSFAGVLPCALRFLAPAVLAPYRQLARRVLGRCDGLTGVSRTFLDWALDHRGAQSRAIPTEVFWPTAPWRDAELERASSGRLRCIFCGTFGAMIDFDRILTAVEAVQRRRPGLLEVDLVGDGPRRQPVEGRFGNLEGVTFHGSLGERDLDRLMRRADVGFCCYVNGAPTTLTTTLFYYLSYGVAVLASPQPELRQLVIDEQLGRVAASSPAFADELIVLAEQRHRLLAHRQAASRFARAHSAERVTARMADFLVRLPR